MTKKQLLARKRRKEQIIQRSIRVGICVVAVLVFIFVITKIAGAIKGTDKKKNGRDTVSVEAPVLGEGDARRVEYIGEESSVGWNEDERGKWYLTEDGTFFYKGWQTIDGVKYYFDEEGYVSTGWVQIDGEDHFFGQDGVEEPDVQRKYIALSYDDGPAESTIRILNCLKAYGAKATFFVVGTQAEYYSEVLKQEDAWGMEIGSHTYDHTTLKGKSSSIIEEKLAKNEEVITGIVGHGTKIMRPVGGGIDDTVRETVKTPMIGWDVDTLDWDTKDPNQTVQRALESVRPGSIILMHDLYSETALATERLVPRLIEEGYTLVTVSELAKHYQYKLEGGQDYWSLYPKAEETSGEEETSAEE